MLDVFDVHAMPIWYPTRRAMSERKQQQYNEYFFFLSTFAIRACVHRKQVTVLDQTRETKKKQTSTHKDRLYKLIMSCEVVPALAQLQWEKNNINLNSK